MPHEPLDHKPQIPQVFEPEEPIVPVTGAHGGGGGPPAASPPPPTPREPLPPPPGTSSRPYRGLFDGEDPAAVDGQAALAQLARLRDKLSRAELEQLAVEFSEIRLGKRSLKLETGVRSGALALPPRLAAWFMNRAMEDIASILATPAGRELVHDMADKGGGRETTVRLEGGARPVLGARALSGSVSYLPTARYEAVGAPAHVVLMRALADSRAGVESCIEPPLATADPALAMVVVLSGIPERGETMAPAWMLQEAASRGLDPAAIVEAARLELGDAYAARLAQAIRATI